MEKLIEGFENYKIDEYGNVTNIKTNRKMKLHLHAKGYLDIGLTNKDVKKKFLIHRLVAKYFIQGYSEYMTIDHLDNNRQNNYYKNLECVSLVENISRSKLRKTRKGKRKQISKNVVVEIFKSRNWEDVESFYEEIMKY